MSHRGWTTGPPERRPSEPRLPERRPSDGGNQPLWPAGGRPEPYRFVLALPRFLRFRRNRAADLRTP